MAEQPEYSDDEAAALYDALNPWAASDDFYLAFVMKSASVLDVGCGTGVLLSHARELGHEGRLCGVDPNPASLKRAGRRGDIEWVRATAAAMRFDREFELAVMTGHAFQVFVEDDDVRESLAAIQRALLPGGRFAFETRNPAVRDWETWRPDNATEIVDPSGRRVCVWYEVESAPPGLVTLTETTARPDGSPLRVDRTSLRFLDAEALDAFLDEAGFVVEARYGDWDRSPFGDASHEIITVARREEES